MRSRGISGCCALLLLFPLLAAEHPDFSGTWQLDGGRSDFGRLPAASSITDKIAQTPEQITVSRDRDSTASTFNVPLNGSASENSVRGVPMKTTAHWNGPELVIEYSGTRNGSTLGFQEQWALAPDGKSFTLKRHLAGPMGETSQTLVMRKQ